MTANGTTTSPVLRGAWAIENLLGIHVPPPPPVPAVEPDLTGATTLRQQLDKHRNDASCASCHSKIDPPGFALESFDAIGGWREWYRIPIGERLVLDPKKKEQWPATYKRGLPVDSTGKLPTGEAFQDIREFKALLKRDPDRIARCLAEKLLTYGLGRGLGFSDRETVEADRRAGPRQELRLPLADSGSRGERSVCSALAVRMPMQTHIAPIDRRHFLRASGVGLALPFLAAFRRAADGAEPKSNAASSPSISALGFLASNFMPAQAGRDYEPTKYLQLIDRTFARSSRLFPARRIRTSMAAIMPSGRF